MRVLIGVVVALAALAGCAGTAANVHKRAASEMGCPPEQTGLVDGTMGIYLFRGCGQEASYQCPELASHCRRIFLRELTPAAEPEP